MARKFGRKNRVNSNVLAHNFALIGEPGVGKTHVINEFCNLIGGEDCYIFLETGKEDGADELEGIPAEPVWTWDKFIEVTDDIIENRETDYKDLQVIVVDTYDQLCSLAEQQVIKLWAREQNVLPKSLTFRGCYNGFNAPYDKAIELIFDRLWELKRCGIYFICIGHTKKKDIVDPISGESYSQLTTDMDSRYFNALKNKVALLGVAYVDREILKYKTGKKNIVTKQEEVKGKVTGESRVICFRDDNFSVDSKSRFADIVDKIPLDANALYKAISDAIAKAQSKTGKSQEQIKTEQVELAKENEQAFNERLETARATRKKEAVESHREEWTAMVRAQVAVDLEYKNAAKSRMNGHRLSEPDFPIDLLKELVDMIPKQ